MAVYLDHNATSPSSQEHLAEIVSRLQSVAGNPSSPHAAGRAASVALTNARKHVARSLSVEPGEVVFVSGGSEANNLATVGIIRGSGRPINSQHAITTSIEHPCVLEPLTFLHKNFGLQLTCLPVDNRGRISLSELVAAIQPNTSLISVMAANNETGAIQPTRVFADWLHEARWSKFKSEEFWKKAQTEVWPAWSHGLDSRVCQTQLQSMHFHVDGVQAYGKIPLSDWWSAGYDSVSVCAHKLGGLSGIGALMLRRGRKFEPLIMGGAQERSRRAGTENLLGVLSLGLVAERLQSPEWWSKITELEDVKNRLLFAVSQLPGAIVNTPLENALPNTVNFSVDGQLRRAEDILLELDMRGFYASSGSACSSAANRPSHVLLAQHGRVELARNGIRFSLSPTTTQQEVTELITQLLEIWQRH